MYTATYQMLSYTDPAANSDKFYRAYLLEDADTSDVRVLFNWGRNGTNGQFQTANVHSRSEGQRAVSSKLADKEKKGYRQVSAGELPRVPEDLLERAGVNTRSQPDREIPVNPIERLSMDADRAVRMLTGPSEVQSEAILLTHSLHDQLDALRRSVDNAEGQIEMVDAILKVKVGA